jgi:hypothetical protein
MIGLAWLVMAYSETLRRSETCFPDDKEHALWCARIRVKALFYRMVQSR